ncbi:hypothetical protein MUK42_35129 [Musa troglodytarum]|uniref:Glycine dehydrogenase C-terminal domain-containing protein n=1 Tax=Musa troglodytarum TaxID=320322 RepID=A0A9E7HR48_9LILI|nr:hypothetical protein MUK42_35129 [Musa troglodytarum]
MSWTEPGTLISESTESKSKAGLDRFGYTLFSVREEIAQIESGKLILTIIS